MFLFCLLFAMSLYASVYMCFVVTCWERADLLALVCGVYCEFVTFPLVSWVRCGTWLYRFLIFAPLLTLTSSVIMTFISCTVTINLCQSVRNLMNMVIYPTTRVIWKCCLLNIICLCKQNILRVLANYLTMCQWVMDILWWSRIVEPATITDGA